MNRGLSAPFACALGFLIAAATAGTAHGELTTSSGGSQPIPNMQPYLGINYLVRIQGGDIGEIKMFAGSFAPGSYALAQGQLLSTSNTALFNALGTTYGGNGTTTFALPDLRSRTPIHLGQGAGLSDWALGQQRGSDNTTLTVGNLPEHAHSLSGHPQPFTGPAGSGTSFPLWQPSLGLNHAIATQGNLPTAGGTGPFLGRMRMFAGTNGLPTGYIPANGQLLATGSFTNLQSVLGNTYGGSASTFALPDLKGRTAMGVGGGAGLTARALGDMLGEESETIDFTEMPIHSHLLPYEPPIVDGTTGTAGSGPGDPIDLLQPSLALRYIIATQGEFPTNTETIAPESPMLGEIAMFAGIGDTAPAGWMFAEGQTLSVSGNLALASILGVGFGGDATTFRLPDLRSRIPVGMGQGVGLPNISRGEKSGVELTQLSLNNLPAHAHEFESIPEPGGATLVLLGVMAPLLRRRRQAQRCR